MNEITDQEYTKGQCCIDCGEFCLDDDLDDNTVCDNCRFEKQNGLKYINERGLKSTFNKWQQTQNK